MRNKRIPVPYYLKGRKKVLLSFKIQQDFFCFCLNIINGPIIADMGSVRKIKENKGDKLRPLDCPCEISIQKNCKDDNGPDKLKCSLKGMAK